MAAHCSSTRYLFLLPLLACLSFPITFGISYGMYYPKSNASWDFPYISETGNTAPESCVFGQLLNIAAVISALTVYVRYKETKQALVQYLPSSHCYRVNFATCVFGMLASFGVSMVGNFQMDSVLLVHFVGAGFAFILGSVYSWLQVYISFKLLMFNCSRPIFFVRIICSLIVTIFLIGTVVGSFLYGVYPRNQSYRLWSTTSEWIMAFGLALLFASFAKEFRTIKFEKPRISIIQEKLQKA
ncbi:DNA damage-regulated autophagy modulator protein 2-like isoform X2 [Watersipora subatra]